MTCIICAHHPVSSLGSTGFAVGKASEYEKLNILGLCEQCRIRHDYYNTDMIFRNKSRHGWSAIYAKEYAREPL